MWTNTKKVCGSLHHKWLLYSCTLILVCFLFNVVKCNSAGRTSGAEAHRLTAIENETTGKARVKAGSVFGNAISNSGNRVEGKSGPGNSITSNELHSSFALQAADEDDSYPDDEDEDYSSYVDSFEEHDPSAGDSDLIKHEHDKLIPHRPVIGKCCQPGHGLAVMGDCGKMKEEHLYHNEHYWFPEKAYDVETEAMVKINISNWLIEIPHKTECQPGERLEVIFDMKRFMFLKDGSLLVSEHNKLFEPLQFCVDHELGRGQGRVVQACFSKEQLCDDKVCLRKCCPKDSFTEEKYSETRMDWRCNHSPSLAKKYNFSEHEILSSSPHCSIGLRVEPLGDYNISKNGTLQTLEYSAPFLSYCVDYFVNKSITGVLDDKMVPELKALVCFNEDLDNIDLQGLIVLPQELGIVFGISMIISAICLAIAAVISWRLPELRSLHGKCQLSHLATMFCLYLSLAIVQLGTQIIPQGLCTFFGVFIHICALSSFLWLNLLCVNIYLTFRSLRPPLAARRDENRRLVFLCIYAWGIPAAFCLFLFILDTTGDRLEPMPSPEYGHLKCLISNRQAEFAYLFGPVGVLLLCNGLLFCLTAQELLCGVWRLDNSDSINFRRKSMGIVVAKLGIVMGMGWILDVLSWAIGARSPYMFYAADLFNSFQGVLISVILLWRKRVLEVLHLRKPSMTKEETLTARPFLPKNGSVNMVSNGDHDTSLVMVNDH